MLRALGRSWTKPQDLPSLNPRSSVDAIFLRVQGRSIGFIGLAGFRAYRVYRV